jgi:single-stranded DNA-binding protein
MKLAGPMTGNRIELDGRIVSPLEYRVTPGGTPVLRAIVECGAQGEDLRLAVVMAGEKASSAKSRLAPGQAVKVSGRLRALKAVLKATRTDAAFEVVAESIEPADS